MAIMMHFTVEPDIRNGLALMKYAVNQPQVFKQRRKGHIDVIRVFTGFYLGFS